MAIFSSLGSVRRLLFNPFLQPFFPYTASIIFPQFADNWLCSSFLRAAMSISVRLTRNT